tara:strand:+ start:77 stop:907 length:831 start_codon:yes stop_codon:yes gene_type:complete
MITKKNLLNIIKHKFLPKYKNLADKNFYVTFLKNRINIDKLHLANRNLIRFCMNSFNYKKVSENDIEIYYEKEEMDVFENLIINSEFFIDIGAQVGIYSLAAYNSKKIKKIVCVEIIKEYENAIINNIKLNNYLKKKFQILNIGLGSGKISHTEWIAKTSTRGVSFEKILQLSKINLNENDCVKIDIEGWEFSLANGLGDFFLKYKPKLLLSFHEQEIKSLSKGNVTDEKLFNFLSSIYRYRYMSFKNELKEIQSYLGQNLNSKPYKTIIFSNVRI